jgi:hypothetical protein
LRRPGSERPAAAETLRAEQSDTVFTAEPNQFSEGRLNGLGVFESYDDVRVDQELETVHR